MFSFHHYFINYFGNSFSYPFDGFIGPYKSILHRKFALFALLPVTSQLMLQFGNDKN